MEYETALLIVPPPPVQAFCYPLREQYDPEGFSRVPAHITLISPFVTGEAIDPAIEKLHSLCSALAPFEVRLNHYGRFADALVLEPDDPQPIIALYEKLHAAFPDYPAYGGEFGEGLHPHVTLAKLDSPEEADRIPLPPEPDFTFTVSKIHLYLGAKDDDAPYVPRAVFPLGG